MRCNRAIALTGMSDSMRSLNGMIVVWALQDDWRGPTIAGALANDPSAGFVKEQAMLMGVAVE